MLIDADSEWATRICCLRILPRPAGLSERYPSPVSGVAKYARFLHRRSSLWPMWELPGFFERHQGLGFQIIIVFLHLRLALAVGREDPPPTQRPTATRRLIETERSWGAPNAAQAMAPAVRM